MGCPEGRCGIGPTWDKTRVPKFGQHVGGQRGEWELFLLSLCARLLRAAGHRGVDGRAWRLGLTIGNEGVAHAKARSGRPLGTQSRLFLCRRHTHGGVVAGEETQLPPCGGSAHGKHFPFMHFCSLEAC